MGLFGIVLGLGLLIFLAYRGWSILLLAPAAALLIAAIAGEPLLGLKSLCRAQAASWRSISHSFCSARSSEN
jgi:H+/gluconate symporter-like permease